MPLPINAVKYRRAANGIESSIEVDWNQAKCDGCKRVYAFETSSDKLHWATYEVDEVVFIFCGIHTRFDMAAYAGGLS